ncbi:MAG TPA: trypsin-like peptidase domain-containing protein [Geminicoccus sp.]|uniref:S1C family serine protease n=1 Tax=Geminicoccus sp. TaxID=2024832 RepID=UPI002CAF3BB9|nr:trypsin-like peptidase domain-containing protein [Geminicoccus sp.]HWL66813.1 trypsin-like peptidase domain-containing protein [Geminicoccus sp.]
MPVRLLRIAILWLLALATLWTAEPYLRAVLFSADEPRAITARGALAEFEQNAIEVFASRSGAVPLIATRGLDGGGTGSGLIWDEAGHIVTNNHVVAGSRDVVVQFGAGSPVPATVIGTAPDYDLAVLRPRISLGAIEPIPLGTSADLTVGQTVYAIGNPFGLSRSMSSGIVSALDRRLPTASGREIRGVIQTDAAINPGNSGGPLLDTAGRLIGVNTAIYSETGSFAGVGFAVPVDVVNEIVPQLIREGHAPRPGIGIATLDERMAARLQVPGIVIAEVLPGGAADRAGLVGIDPRTQRLGDVITHVEGREVHTIAELAEHLTRAGIGSEVELTVIRDGQERRVRVEVIDIA